MKRYIIALIFLLLLTGCTGEPVSKSVKAIPAANRQNNNYDLAELNIILPSNWRLDTGNEAQYNFIDEKGKNKGWISSIDYEAGFDFRNVKPNHSSIINDESLDNSLGKCRLFTLDADNGTAASGITGTHNDYYAVITVEDKKIYMLEFSNNDKDLQPKEQFIEILKNLSFK